MNKCFLSGRLVRDPESRTAGDLQVTRFSIAVYRYSKTETTADYINVVTFRGKAEFAKKYFHKGMKILVVGNIKTSSYEKDGAKHYFTEIYAEELEFAESKKTEGETPAGDGFVDIPENIEAELPFK